MTKTCSRCRTSQAVTAFNKRALSLDGLSVWCKECNYSYNREWRVGRTDLRKYDLKSRTGITLEQYEQMLLAQGGRCAICRSDTPGGPGAFHLDHDHSCCPGTKMCPKCTRGLLCWACNGALGKMGDDPERLEAAAAYLRNGGYR